MHNRIIKNNKFNMWNRERTYKKINDAIEVSIRARSLESELTNLFQFNGFENDDYPIVMIYNDSACFLIYHGGEMYIEDAIQLMETSGYITPQDFIRKIY